MSVEQAKIEFDSERGRHNVPEEHRKVVLQLYHDDIRSGGHSGMTKTYDKLNKRFFWKNMKADSEDYVRSCHLCQIHKFTQRKKKCKLTLPNASLIKFNTLHLDYGEIAKKGEGVKTTKSFILAIDEATRFCFTKNCRESAEAVVNFLEALELDECKVIVSDNGKCFTSKRFIGWLDDNEINLINTTAYHPEGNGLAERKMRDLKTFMKIYEEEVPSWTERLKLATWWSNNSVCRAIGCSPQFKVCGQSNQLPADELLGLAKNLKKEKPMSLEEIENYRAKTKTDHDKNSREIPKIADGEYILVQLGLGKQSKVVGPFKVVEGSKDDKPFVTYEADDKSTKSCHVKNLAKYHLRSKYN